MKWFSGDDEELTRFEMFVMCPTGVFVFLSLVAYLLLISE
jgi:hypothetical protein